MRRCIFGLEASRTFLVLRTTGFLVLAGVTTLFTVVDAPSERGAEGRAELGTPEAITSSVQSIVLSQVSCTERKRAYR